MNVFSHCYFRIIIRQTCPCWTGSMFVTRFWSYIFPALTLNVRGPSYLGLTRYHGCWCPGSLCCQDISSHDIGYVEYVGPGLTWGRILSTCVISIWSYDIKCKYMFMFPLKNLARKGLTHQYMPSSWGTGWPLTTPTGIIIALKFLSTLYLARVSLPISLQLVNSINDFFETLTPLTVYP